MGFNSGFKELNWIIKYVTYGNVNKLPRTKVCSTVADPVKRRTEPCVST